MYLCICKCKTVYWKKIHIHLATKWFIYIYIRISSIQWLSQPPKKERSVDFLGINIWGIEVHTSPTLKHTGVHLASTSHSLIEFARSMSPVCLDPGRKAVKTGISCYKYQIIIMPCKVKKSAIGPLAECAQNHPFYYCVNIQNKYRKYTLVKPNWPPYWSDAMFSLVQWLKFCLHVPKTFETFTIHFCPRENWGTRRTLN